MTTPGASGGVAGEGAGGRRDPDSEVLGSEILGSEVLGSEVLGSEVLDSEASPLAGDAIRTSLGTTPADVTQLDLPDDRDVTGAHPGESLDLVAAVEAVLLVTDQPVSSGVLARVIQCPEADAETALHALAGDYAERRSGIEVRCVAGGWRLYTRAEFSRYVERFLVDGQQARLTQAALETLAVIAYRQPVTRSRVSAVRGVNVDGVVRTLVSRGLVTETGHDEGSGAALYATTELFLERLGLAALSGLPSLAPLLPELTELDDGSTSS